MTTPHRPVLVVDFGAQYAQLIARRVREAKVYSEIVPHTITADEVAERNPLAIILSGGPSSVYEPGSPSLDPGIVALGIPVFGICYGFQVMAQQLGGVVANTGLREYGSTDVEVNGGVLFDGQPAAQTCWMSHGDRVESAPPGFSVTASTSVTPVAAFENPGAKMFGVQWHPEVLHSEYGQRVLENFLWNGAGIAPEWTSGNVIEEQVAAVREQVGDDLVICGLSGGVDSAVAAALVHRAVGDQLICVFVDHGLLRAGEREQVERDFVAATGVRLVTVDVADTFLEALAGVTDPEEKRKVIGREFIRAFEAAEADLVAEAANSGKKVRFLVQGTLYPDVVESGADPGPRRLSRTIMLAVFPTTCSSNSSNHCVPSSRTRFAPSVGNLVCPRPSSDVNRSPVPGSGSALSARSRAIASSCCAPLTRLFVRS